MPVNAAGSGPEMDPTKVVETLHEIVDFHNKSMTVGYGVTAEKAIQLTDQLNKPDFLQDVMDFHAKFGQGYDGPARKLPNDLHLFREGFMQEELDEYSTEHTAMEHRRTIPKGLELQLDALADLLWVTLGTVEVNGFARIFRAAWNRVVTANMAKVKAVATGDDRSKRDAKFDIVKPAGWKAPDHGDLIVYAMSLPEQPDA